MLVERNHAFQNHPPCFQNAIERQRNKASILCKVVRSAHDCETRLQKISHNKTVKSSFLVTILITLSLLLQHYLFIYLNIFLKISLKNVFQNWSFPLLHNLTQFLFIGFCNAFLKVAFSKKLFVSISHPVTCYPSMASIKAAAAWEIRQTDSLFSNI